MAISVACECGKLFRAQDEAAGKRTKCPACGRPLTIPVPALAQSVKGPVQAPAVPSTRQRSVALSKSTTIVAIGCVTVAIIFLFALNTSSDSHRRKKPAHAAGGSALEYGHKVGARTSKKKPANAAGRNALTVTKPALQPLFDSSDLRPTSMWAAEIIRPLNQIRNDDHLRTNRIAYEDAWTKAWEAAQQKSQEPLGRSIAWRLRVEEIDRRSVKLNRGFDGSGNPASGLDVRLQINTNLAPLGNSPLVQEASLTIGENISREKAAALRSGDHLTITGVVNEVYMSQLIDGLWLTVELKDLHALD